MAFSSLSMLSLLKQYIAHKIRINTFLASKSIFEIDSIKTSQEYLIKMLIALINASLLDEEIMKFNKMKMPL